MAKRIKQIRFNTNGYDTYSTVEAGKIKFRNGTAFFADENNTVPEGEIVKLKIQGLPGIKFYLNNSTYPILIGAEGIYELDYEGVRITALKFDGSSLNNLSQNFVTYPLIVDAVYDDRKDD